MTISTFDLRSRLSADAGENSIMQTITIAVSAILIAAGLVTAPGLINNARDNNARTDLANIAFSQEFNLANTGEYAASIAALDAAAQAAIDSGTSGPRLTRSGGVFVKVVPGAGNDSYTLYAISQSGAVFERSSGSGETSFVGDIDWGTIADADKLTELNDTLDATPEAPVLPGALTDGGWE